MFHISQYSDLFLLNDNMRNTQKHQKESFGIVFAEKGLRYAVARAIA